MFHKNYFKKEIVRSKKLRLSRGFTLVETLVGTAVFLLIAITVWQGFVKTIEAVGVLRTRNTATALANELFEVVRNMPYEDVGIVDGLPAGKIPKTQIIEKDGRRFEITASVVNIDLEFDGVIGGDPNDLSPADNKLVEFILSCVNCDGIEDLDVTTTVAPQNLESSGDNGALFVQVVDADGSPIQGADVEIQNDDADPAFLVEETTNNDGMFQLVDAPPGTESYQITVTKNGFTTDKTYTPDEPENPFPDKPHANVSTGQITQVTFAIDEFSEVNFNAVNQSCSSVNGLDFDFYGEKTIGEDVLKYSKSLVTNSSGDVSLSDVEWDTYHLDITDAGYYLAGSNPFLPIAISPGTEYDLDLILDAQNPNALLVRVIDGNEGLPIASSTIELILDSTETKVTGQGSRIQSEWSSSGQELIGDETRYYSQDGNIDTSNGELKLTNISGTYSSYGELTSSIFDIGEGTSYITFNWKPQSQIAETGEGSVKFKIATASELNEETVWNYLGPNGSSETFYESSGQAVAAVHDGDKYFRYKVYLSTEDILSTPIITDVSFSFTNGCLPAGQVYFDGLEEDVYEIRVTKEGYEDYYSEGLNIDSSWQSIDVILQEN